MIYQPHTVWKNLIDTMLLTCENSISISECACPTYSETTPVKRQKTSSAENPRHFFIHLLLKHPEGLWDRAESAENSAHWERCTEYFNLLYQLLYCLQGISNVLTVLIVVMSTAYAILN